MDKKRVSSGIPGLDPLIEGGFPEGKSYLITGESGTGKSIFCIQFILKGLMEGEKAVYVAVDEKPADILEEAASLGWDLLKYIEQKSLLILDASPLFSSRMGAGKEKEVDVQKTVADLTAYVKRMGASRVVIDPVGPLILSRDSSVRAQEHVRTLVHSLQDTMGTTNLLTSYAIPGITGAGDGAIEDSFDPQDARHRHRSDGTSIQHRERKGHCVETGSLIL
ncbi:MAG: AAA family ATPase [Deltaproteobacteria bacterium]|nr:AAA family ATPase [Deltaproteobacteria bacterium]